MSKETDFTQLLLENQICFPLYAASRMMTKIYTPFLKKLDLTYPQYLVMMVLWEHQHKSVNEIGSLLFLESNTLTPLLKRMEEKKLLKRTRSPKDERKVLISISSKGQELQKEASEIPFKMFETIRGTDHNYEEIEDFRSSLQQLAKNLHQQL
ncbi:MAG: MarR family transcriptional regulator [Flavobacteriales bacterium]|jgi:DNA-binding MarR family transcriptional regulator|nr:MarR family transcriptional regulator [Flavobacteriales bacterium]